MSSDRPYIPGAEHDIPPLTPAARAALEGANPLDADVVSAAAVDEDDPDTARELRSRALMLKAGAGPADPNETRTQIQA